MSEGHVSNSEGVVAAEDAQRVGDGVASLYANQRSNFPRSGTMGFKDIYKTKMDMY